MNKRFLILVLVLFVLLAGAMVLYNEIMGNMEMDNLVTGETEATRAPEATQEPEDDQPQTNENLAPDFTVYDLQGNAHSLSDFRGQPVIVNFWASWCGPCKSEMPDFDDKYLEYGDDIHFMMVNLTDGGGETVETAQGYVDSQGYSFPVYFDTDYSGAIAYSVNAVPATYFIDENGAVAAYGVGAMSAEDLQRGIDMLLD